MQPLNIAVSVGGKFSSEAAATALHRAGHSVRVFTSLPKRSFSDELERHSILTSELVYRLGKRLGFENQSDLVKMRVFGRETRRRLLKKNPPDVVLGWSSFSKELFSSSIDCYKILVRESTHIEYQQDLLQKEHGRLGLKFESRRQIVERELEEYALSDRILVCSQLAKETFIQKGIDEDKINVIPLGIDTSEFRPRRQHTVRRPLQLLYAGALSVRKGIVTLLEATEKLSPDLVQLTCVGPVEPILKKILSKYQHCSYLPALPHRKMAPLMREFDAFAFPTLEDGYGSVLIQAMGSGLVPIASTQAGSSEWINHLQNGILVAPKETEAWTEAIQRLALDHPLYHRLRKESLELRPAFDLQNYNQALVDYVQSVSY